MKQALATTLFWCLSAPVLAQTRAQEQAAINAQVDAMLTSWNQHNYADMKNYTTEDTDWVNVVGMWWKGRKESQYAHQVYHQTMFKTSVGEKKAVAIRFVTKDVAIVHVEWHFSDPTPVPLPDGKIPGPNDDLATLVFVKQKGKWLLTAGENVHVDKAAQPFDPVNHMPKD
jgi:uncharacterized protein (TIGR02246 family)